VDTLLGKGHRQAIVTLTERKSRFTLLRKVDQRTADQVGDAVIEVLQPVKGRLYTLTADNGKEFAEHERIAQELQADFFFAHPFAAWERGTNENMNGLIRQYIPKKHDLASVSDADLVMIMKRLNHRPRKCLEFLSPFEVFINQSVALTS
jgi:IS30 family transposase